MKVQITETALRDAQQSLLATRMPLEDFLPILETMDKAGYYSLECWGGATFDSCLRYLNEDPWQRLRTIRRHVTHTKLQMLLRGQNLLGYQHYPDDVVRAFVRKSVENGIDIIRVFDALNDLSNLTVAINEAKACGALVSGALCYTVSPIHSTDLFVSLGKQLEQMGCDSVCIKDMAGILSPATAYELVSRLKESLGVPVVVHTHCTTGLGQMTLLRAAEAGADVLDCAIACLSGGASQPATETMDYVLHEMGCDTGLDTASLKQINDFFRPVRDRALRSGLLSPIVLGVDPDALTYQVPGGMLSNLVAQLTAQKKLDCFQQVLEEVPRVRRDLGYPPLVTPSSQMVGVQAANNVLAGQRYKVISKEVKAYLRGEYGRAPGPIDPQLRQQALGEDTSPSAGKPDLEACRREIGDLAVCEEDVLSYSAFPQVAEAFLRARRKKEENAVLYTMEAL